MKLKLCRNVHNISLYKNCVFYCRCSCAFVAMATYSFHILIMGKVKVALYFYLIADILTKKFQKCSLSSPLPNIWILSKPLNLIGCHHLGNWKDKSAKFFWKIISAEAIRGMKLKLCRNVHNSILYKVYVFYCRCSCAFVAMFLINLKFPLTYNEKSESSSLLVSHCRYFDRTFW